MTHFHRTSAFLSAQETGVVPPDSTYDYRWTFQSVSQYSCEVRIFALYNFRLNENTRKAEMINELFYTDGVFLLRISV